MKIGEHFSDKTTRIKTVFRQVNSNWVVSVSSKGTFILIAASIIALILRWNNLPKEVPLWYAKTWGEDRLASPLWLILLPLGSLFWHVTNLCIAVFVTYEYLVFTQLLFITSFLVSLLSFATLTKILLLVG